MEISRLYINIYVTMNARVVWLFSFVHFHEPAAPPPKRAPWYLQCAAWLETSSRRALLDFVVQVYWTNRPGGVRKRNMWLLDLVFQMSNKGMKNWTYATPQQLVQVMYILQVQISPGNFQTSHNFFRHFSFQGSVSWDQPNIATGHLTIVETLRLSWVPSSHESLWKYTIPSFWGMMWWSTVVVLFWCVTCVGVGILVKIYSHASTGAMNHTTVVSRIWALGVFHAIQEGCYISYCRKWYQPNIKQPTHGIAGNNANKMHNAHFVSNIWNTCCKSSFVQHQPSKLLHCSQIQIPPNISETTYF